MEPTRRRRFGIALLVAVASAGVGIAFLGGHIAGSWQETLDWAQAEQERYEKQDFRRPVLWGPTRRGLATIHYREAADVIAAHRDLGDSVDRRLRLRGADPGEREAALKVLAPALDALREGAHCVDARRTLDWEQGFSQTASLLDYRTIANLATMRARMLLAEGDANEAVRVLLDGAQLGRDLMQAPILIDQMIGGAILTIAVQGTADTEFVEALPEPALRELAAGLEVLDENLPTAQPGVHVETVLLVHQLEQGTDSDLLGEEWPGFWNSLRYGFSRRWILAEGIAEMIEFGETRAHAGHLPWPQAEQLMQKAAEAVKARGNPLAAIATPNLASASRVRRLTMAQLRLLRTEVAHRLGQVLVLHDPMGDGPLRLVEDEEGMYFRSAAVRMGKPIQRPVPR